MPNKASISTPGISSKNLQFIPNFPLQDMNFVPHNNTHFYLLVHFLLKEF